MRLERVPPSGTTEFRQELGVRAILLFFAGVLAVLGPVGALSTADRAGAHRRVGDLVVPCGVRVSVQCDATGHRSRRTPDPKYLAHHQSGMGAVPRSSCTGGHEVGSTL